MKGFGLHIHLAARHRFEKIDRRAVAYIVHTERICGKPAAEFTNEVSRSAVNAAAIIAQARRDIHGEMNIARLFDLKNLDVIPKLRERRECCISSSR